MLTVLLRGGLGVRGRVGMRVRLRLRVGLRVGLRVRLRVRYRVYSPRWLQAIVRAHRLSLPCAVRLRLGSG